MATVYLSPSLQEFNTGVGDYGTEEERMNQVADVVQRELTNAGITVYRNSPEMSLAQAVADSNRRGPDVHVAIHSNASATGQARGPEVYVYSRSSPAYPLAQLMYASLEAISPTPGLGVRVNPNLYELRRTRAPAVLAEVAFHDNPQDAQWIISNIEGIGKAIAGSVIEFLATR